MGRDLDGAVVVRYGCFDVGHEHGLAFAGGALVGVSARAHEVPVTTDEASLAGTASLDRISDLAERAGAKVPPVGDAGQLQSVDSGGAFSMLVGARDDAPELLNIHRFAHALEKTTSLQLRHGRSQAIDPSSTTAGSSAARRRR